MVRPPPPPPHTHRQVREGGSAIARLRCTALRTRAAGWPSTRASQAAARPLRNLPWPTPVRTYLRAGKFGLGAKMALIWSKMTTGLPFEITSARPGSATKSHYLLDIDIHK